MPIHRTTRVAPQSTTERKYLAQKVRNELSFYKQVASLEAPEEVERRDVFLMRADRRLTALLELEGLERQA